MPHEEKCTQGEYYVNIKAEIKDNTSPSQITPKTANKPPEARRETLNRFSLTGPLTF